MAEGDYAHAAVSLNAILEAPSLWIPENVFDKSANGGKAIKADLGRIQISSDLRQFSKTLDYKTIKDESKLYDNYTLEMDRLSVTL